MNYSTTPTFHSQNEKNFEMQPIQKEPPYVTIKDGNDNDFKITEMHVWEAMMTGNIENLKIYMELFKANNALLNKTPNNSKMMFRGLVPNPEFHINMIHHRQCTLLHSAFASKGAEEVIKLLLENGADCNIPILYDFLNKTALELAIDGPKNINVVKMLLEHGADCNVKNMNGQSVLYRAVGHHCIETVKLLVQYGARVNELFPLYAKIKTTPLYFAVDANYPEIVEILLDAGADCDAENIEPYKESIGILKDMIHNFYMFNKNNKPCMKILFHHNIDIPFDPRKAIDDMENLMLKTRGKLVDSCRSEMTMYYLFTQRKKSIFLLFNSRI